MAYSTVTFNEGQPATITFVASHSIDTAPWQFVDLGDVSGRPRQDLRDHLRCRFQIKTSVGLAWIITLMAAGGHCAQTAMSKLGQFAEFFTPPNGR
jgi:hypothetical protein